MLNKLAHDTRLKAENIPFEAARANLPARLGPLFCAFLKIGPVFFFVLPGVICVALVQKGAFGGAAPQTAADTYTFLITHLLPVGRAA